MNDLKRNDRCPCGSGRKTKRCCKHLLTVRNEKISLQFQRKNGYAEHQKQVKYGKTEPLTYAQWLNQENERKMQELNNEGTEHVG